MNDLKKCPFCGGKASLFASRGRHGDFGYVKCLVCSASSGTKKLKQEYSESEWDNDAILFDDPAFYSVTIKWNMRDYEETKNAEPSD